MSARTARTNLDGSGPITLGGGSANATLLTEGPYWTKSTVPGDITAAGGSTGTLTIESENQNNTANGPGITYTGNVILNSNLTLANLTPSSTTAANFCRRDQRQRQPDRRQCQPRRRGAQRGSRASPATYSSTTAR